MSLLYPCTPSIQTNKTYTTVYIDLPHYHLPVKVPSGNFEHDKLMYLLHKELYFHHLNQNHNNPLFGTASIIMFESSKDWSLAYNHWLTKQPFPKNTLLRPIAYIDQLTLAKYLIIAKQKNEKNSYLVRSRRDG